MRSAIEVQTGATSCWPRRSASWMPEPTSSRCTWTGRMPTSRPGRANEVAAVDRRGPRAGRQGGRPLGTPQRGTRGGAGAAWTSIEHGFELDGGVAAEMAARGITLVSTLAVHALMAQLRRYDQPGAIRRGGRAGGGAAPGWRRARASIRVARDAGVRIATGSDFGGGSLRANQLAWEVTSLVAAGIAPVERAGGRDVARRRAARRGRCRRHPRRRPGRLLPGSR